MSRPRPLEPVHSIKVKWSIVIVAAVAVTALMTQIGIHLGWPVWLRPVVAGALALLMVQFLAHGTTYPLRQMSRAAEAMSRGDYSSRVAETGNDEVGQLARTFNQMAGELAEVSRTQKEFIANASHELRTPVAALRSTLENLVDGVGQPDQHTLGLMLAQAEHLSRLVSQLLDLSRLESLSDQLDSERIDVGDLLHSLAAEARLTHPTALVEVKAPLGLRISGDERRLRHLFSNVIANAIRFSPIGSPVTIVASRQGVGRTATARIAVRDEGPGIAAADRKRVFERFWQVDGTSLTGGGGAGLGLAISQRIVEQHLGDIEILDNRTDGNATPGTCVVVTLPEDNKAAD
jgi:signal transduction histidine kinase